MASKIHEKPTVRDIIVWFAAVIVSLILLFAGNRLVGRDLDIFNIEGAYTAKAVVTELGESETDSYALTETVVYENSAQYFYARVISGDFKGETLYAAQTSDNYTSYAQEDPVEVGDRVILYNYGTPQGDADWVFGGYARFGPVMWLGIAFFALLILFGQLKGLNTIVSLSFTVLAVFAVFVPSVLAGWNVYLMTVLTCIYTIVMTLVITNGATYKSFTTILGCSFGVFMAALLELLFRHLMRLTGMIDEHSIYLQYLSNGVEIDLNSLIFAMVVIGAMGAVMDVAMDISSSLAELHHHAPHLKFMDLVKSGLTIGRDIMGTMANTLVLAYIGSSLCSVLLLITYSSSLMELLNREGIAVEIMQSLIGSMAILLTIPLTSLVCAFVYTHDRKEKGALPEENAHPAKTKDSAADYQSIIPEEPRQFFYDGNKKA